ncbi:MAG: hypothetical protein V1921_03600 [Candidatus Altiarchaeota archaeon]
MDLRGVYTGVKASILASSCCTLPLLLVYAFSLLGAGSVTAALAIPRYKGFFIAAGMVFLASSLYMTIKKRCRGTCNLGDVNANRSLVLVSVTTYVILTIVIIYYLLPVIAELVFS